MVNSYHFSYIIVAILGSIVYFLINGFNQNLIDSISHTSLIQLPKLAALANLPTTAQVPSVTNPAERAQRQYQSRVAQAAAVAADRKQRRLSKLQGGVSLQASSYVHTNLTENVREICIFLCEIETPI